MALLLVFASFLIPVHRTSIWMDIEFTGWVVPIANRMAEGMRLYADGGHSPMPPLAFVLTRLVSAGRGTWILESALNSLVQCGALLLTYAALAPRCAPGVGFWATLAAVPVFLALPKCMLYDSLAQLWVAAAALVTLRASESLRRSYERVGPEATGVPLRPFLLPGAVIGLALLTKQSTGLGTLVGTILLLAFGTPYARERDRYLGAARLVAVVLVTVAILSLAMAWAGAIDARGLVVDVFARGAEPKGGARALLSSLFSYAWEVVRQLIPWGGIAALLVWAGAPFLFRSSPAGRSVAVAGPGRVIGWLLPPLGGFLGYMLAWTDLHGVPPVGAVLDRLRAVLWETTEQRNSPILWTGWYAAVALMVSRLRRPRAGTTFGVDAMGGLALVLIPAAVFHSLSVQVFRWSYDNNPLIVVALAALLTTLRAGLERSRPRFAYATPLLGVLILLCTWSIFAPELRVAAAANQKWPEIVHLAGARLRPSAEGMRSLVHLVRREASEREAVLLLPEDPNVEAWFDRPRPRLTSAVVFVDQYWDRFVDEDFRRLESAPPKVVVLGPRAQTEFFNRQWGDPRRGVNRLIRRVREELLPERYRQLPGHEIDSGGHRDFLEVFVRID